MHATLQELKCAAVQVAARTMWPDTSMSNPWPLQETSAMKDMKDTKEMKAMLEVTEVKEREVLCLCVVSDAGWLRGWHS